MEEDRARAWDRVIVPPPVEIDPFVAAPRETTAFARKRFCAVPVASRPSASAAAPPSLLCASKDGTRRLGSARLDDDDDDDVEETSLTTHHRRSCAA
jgi:hypothetical protein